MKIRGATLLVYCLSCTKIEVNGRVNRGIEFQGTDIQFIGNGKTHEFPPNTPVEADADGNVTLTDNRGELVNIKFAP